jgi:nascent polypeptide-associated complex subunit alpha
MFPGGLNPRQMKQMMKQMGIKTEEIDATAVAIICADREIVIEGPEVMKMVVSGNEIYTISGGKAKVQAPDAAAEVSDDDVKMVAEQAGVSEEEAKKTLQETKGDIAEAIMKLKG